MKLSGMQVQEAQGTAEVSLRVASEGGKPCVERVGFRLPAELLAGQPPPGDLALPLALLPAMRRGEDLCVAWPVSARLLASAAVIQDIYTVWKYARRRVAVQATAAAVAPLRTDRGVACFITGGVDSWYTFLKHRDEITHLVYVHGFDVVLSDAWRREQVSALVRRIGAAYGKQVVEVETDLRAFSDEEASWNFYHGAGLGVVALLLGNAVRKVYIPGTFTYADVVPLGSHPMLDPLWSSGAVDVVHDGCEASRLDKVRFIGSEPLVRESLRVCWHNVGQQWNCGVCEKCLRTMICLEIAGVPCRTFPARLDLDAVARLPFNRQRWLARYGQFRESAEQAGRHDLARAIATMMQRRQRNGVRVALRLWLRRLRRPK